MESAKRAIEDQHHLALCLMGGSFIELLFMQSYEHYGREMRAESLDLSSRDDDF